MVNLSPGNRFDTLVWTGAYGSDGTIRVGDFNGDGKSDVMMWRDANKDWTANLSTGSGFTLRVWNGWWGSDGPVSVGDFNHDGKDDLAIWHDASRQAMVSPT